jgi:uncharacterized protein
MSRFFGFVFAACLLTIGPPASAQAANPDWPKSLSLVTSSPGGLFYLYGETLANILTEKLGISVNPFPTQGSVQNVKLLHREGGAQLALLVMGTALHGWNGTGDWTNGEKFRNMRALFPLYDSPLQAYALQQSGITAFAQLNDKRIGVGPKGNALEAYFLSLSRILGISAKTTRNGSHAAMVSELLDRSIDAYLTLQGAPVPAVQEVESKGITIFSLSPEQIGAIRKAMPEFTPSILAAGTYRFLDKEYNTVGSTILQPREPIFRTIWCTRSSKQPSRTSRV